MAETTCAGQEVWKDISGFEGHYAVSNYGRVKSLERTLPHKRHGRWTIKERILRPGLSGSKGSQYLAVALHVGEGKFELKKIHRLVAEAFVPAEDGKNVVNHIDGDRTNNHADNLEWCTDLENTHHAWERGLCEGVGKYQCRAVINIDTVERFESIVSAARKYGVTAKAIRQACTGRCKRSCGFRWKFAEERSAEGGNA